MDIFEQQTGRYIELHRLPPAPARLVVALSGGADSVALLAVLTALGYDCVAAHCNFHLRGDESMRDRRHAEAVSGRLGVDLCVKDFDVEARRRATGESVEMACRELRYAWFADLIDRQGARAVAVGHHREDVLETFFINLLRGTGLKGLTGINHRMGKVVRPLMFASRKEILEYAVARRIPFREDSSNRSTKYLRNKIRLGIVPMIREINPKFTSIMRGNLYRLNDAQQFVESAIAKIRDIATESRDGVDTIYADRIDAAFPRNFVIYELLNSSYGFKGDVVDELCRALEQGLTGKRFYSREYVACIDRSNVAVTRIGDDDSCETVVEQNAMRSYCGNSVLYFDHTDIDNITDYSVPHDVALIDESKLRYPLRLRRWREGDWFIPFGMTGRKKVSDYLIDRKVSVIEKNRQFVLVSGDDIVWLVGMRIDDRYRIDNSTENILRIYREIL